MPSCDNFQPRFIIFECRTHCRASCVCRCAVLPAVAASFSCERRAAVVRAVGFCDFVQVATRYRLTRCYAEW